MTWIIAGALWVLTVVRAVGYRRGQDPTVLACSLVFALSFSTDIDEIFQPIDVALGGWNSTNLAGHLLFSTGVYLLAGSIIQGAGPSRFRLIDLSSRAALAVVLCVQLISFLLIRTNGPAGAFATVYGEQAAAVWYSMSEIIFAIGVLGMTGFVCFGYLNKMKSRRFRTGFLLTGIGCALAALTEATSIEYVIRIYTRTLDSMSFLSALHSPLYVLAVLTLVAGLTTPPLMRNVASRSRNRAARTFLADLAPLWSQATAERSHMRIAPDQSDISRLHRMVVEIRDAALNDATVWPALMDSSNGRIESLVTGAEALLGRRDATVPV
jgi:hypothetical protein